MGEKKRLKTGWKVLLWIVGVWAVLLAAVQLALSPSVLTRLANRYAAEYVDADVSFGEVRLSVLRSFPYLNIGFSDFTLTYRPALRHRPAAGADPRQAAHIRQELCRRTHQLERLPPARRQ